MKRLIPALMALGLILSCSGGQQPGSPQSSSSTDNVPGETVLFNGFVVMKDLPEHPDVVREQQDIVAMAATVLSPAAPASVDLSANMPPIGNQGGLGSCSTWSTVYYCKTYHERREVGWGVGTTDHQFSPMYVFNQLSSSATTGLYVSDVMKLLIAQGCDTINYFPVQTDAAKWVRTFPDAASKARAAVYKAGSQRSIGGDVNGMKNELAAGNPVVVSIPVFPDFYLNSSNTVYDNFGGTLAGYHAVCVVGYDDNRQAFKFANSWGTGYGSGGYGWMSYSICNRSDFACSVLYDAKNSNASSAATSLVSGGVYEFVSAVSGKALDLDGWSTADGAKIQQWSRHGGACQQWRVLDMGNGLKLQSVSSGKVLDIPGADAHSGQKVQQWSDNGTNAQRFGAAHLGNGVWRFWPVLNGGLSLDVSGSSTADGAQVQVWNDNGTNAQKWILYKR